MNIFEQFFTAVEHHGWTVFWLFVGIEALIATRRNRGE